MKIQFHVVVPRELDAGIRGCSEDIEVKIENLPPSAENEMTEELRTFFSEWYDTKQVYTKTEWDKIVEEDRKEAERCRRL